MKQATFSPDPQHDGRTLNSLGVANSGQQARFLSCEPYLRGAILGAALLMAGTSATAQAQSGDTGWQQAKTCAQISDRLKRLTCFDLAFAKDSQASANGDLDSIKTKPALEPVPNPNQRQPLAESSILPQLNQVLDQRSTLDTGWLVRLNPWGTDVYLTPQEHAIITRQLAMIAPAPNSSAYTGLTNTGQANTGQSDVATVPQGDFTLYNSKEVDVFATLLPTQQSLDSLDFSQASAPVLSFSCINGLATAGLYAPDMAAETDLRITLQLTEHTDVSLRWQAFDYDKIYYAGRGKESMDLIQSLDHHNRLQLIVDDKKLPQALVFDLSGIKDVIRPIQQTCGIN